MSASSSSSSATSHAHCASRSSGCTTRCKTSARQHPIVPSTPAIAALVDRLEHTTPEQVFKQGLHEFLQDFLELISNLHAALAMDYFEAQVTERPCAT